MSDERREEGREIEETERKEENGRQREGMDFLAHSQTQARHNIKHSSTHCTKSSDELLASSHFFSYGNRK